MRDVRSWFVCKSSMYITRPVSSVVSVYTTFVYCLSFKFVDIFITCDFTSFLFYAFIHSFCMHVDHSTQPSNYFDHLEFSTWLPPFISFLSLSKWWMDGWMDGWMWDSQVDWHDYQTLSRWKFTGSWWRLVVCVLIFLYVFASHFDNKRMECSSAFTISRELEHFFWNVPWPINENDMNLASWTHRSHRLLLSLITIICNYTGSTHSILDESSSSWVYRRKSLAEPSFWSGFLQPVSVWAY